MMAKSHWLVLPKYDKYWFIDYIGPIMHMQAFISYNMNTPNL